MSERGEALLVGTLAFAVGFLGAGRPSLWVDEAATISASTRSVADLAALLQHVDAVHGLYYLMMHGWLTVAPAGEAWARLPSAVMVGAAAAGVVVLGRQLSNRAVGITAGVVFAILPRTTWAAIEARPYALTMACSVWLTVLFVAAVRGNRFSLWLGYAVALAVTAAVNVFVLLLLAAHGFMLAMMPRSRRQITAWGIAAAAAVLAVLPLLMVIGQQRAQVGWIWPISAVTLGQIFGEQYFPSVYSDTLRAVGPDQQGLTAEQLQVAMYSWARVAPLIVVVIVLAGLAFRGRRRIADVIGADPRPLVAGCAAWMVVPTAILVGYSLIGEPVYQPQYLSFTTAAPALLIGLCVVVVGRETRRIVALVLLLTLAAAPNYLAQRTTFAKYGSDYSQVADLFAARAAVGDCLYVDDTTSPSVADAVEGARLEHHDGMRDIARSHDAAQSATLFSPRQPVTARTAGVRDCAVLWTVTDLDGDLPAYQRAPDLSPGPGVAGRPVFDLQKALGFELVERWQFNQTQVVRAVRHQPAGP